MGAETALLGATRADPAEAEEIVRELFPGHTITPAGESTLASTFPPGEALRALFGFVVEGMPGRDEVALATVPTHVFVVVKPEDGRGP